MKKTEKKRNMFIVSWSEWDIDTDNLSVGSFEHPYRSLKSAMEAVMKCILSQAEDLLSMYDPEDRKDAYGTDDPKELVKELVTMETRFTVEVKDPTTVAMYLISKYEI